MYRSTSSLDTATYSAALPSTTTTSSFTVSFPASPWSTPPTVLHSITSLTFNGGLTFDFTVTSVNRTAVQCTVTYLSVISKIGLSFLTFDSTLYPTTLTSYTYTAPAGVSGHQTITVLGMQNHQATFLTAFDLILGSIPGGFIPEVLS